MKGIYVIIVFLCVQELTNASYYRIPKRYFKKPRQEIKQANNVPVKIPARSIPVLQLTENIPEVTAVPKTIERLNANIAQNIPEVSAVPETIEQLNANIVLNDEIPILKIYQPLLKYELPKMTTLPILTILPIVASLPVVNVAPKLRETLPEVKIQDAISYPVDDEFEDDDESEEDVEDSSVTVNILQEVKYEIFKREQKKSPILHKVHRIEEFKRNIMLDRREDPRSERVRERDGSKDLKEYLQRIAVRAELQKN